MARRDLRDLCPALENSHSGGAHHIGQELSPWQLGFRLSAGGVSAPNSGCASPRFCLDVKSTAWGISSARSPGITFVHVPLALTLVRTISFASFDHTEACCWNLALPQQITVLRRRPPKPKLRALDKLFWVLARPCWSAWKQSLVVVTPETVVRWHRAGFRLNWSFRASSPREKTGWQEKAVEGSQGLDLPHGSRESDPGCPPPRSWRVAYARLDVAERLIPRWMQRAPGPPRRNGTG